jgi:hypothetical protein
MALLRAEADEKLSLLRYLATCGQMGTTKLDAYLSMFENSCMVHGEQIAASICGSRSSVYAKP